MAGTDTARPPRASVPVAEPPALVARLDNVAMVCQAVEQGAGHAGVAEHRRPLLERQVRGDDHWRVFVQARGEVEQELAPAAREGQVAEFVELC